MTAKNRILELLRKERTAVLTASEQQELTNWLSIPKNASLYHKLKDAHSEQEALNRLEAYDTEAQLTQLLEKLPEQQSHRKGNRRWLQLATLGAACVAAAFIIITQTTKPEREVETVIVAGTDKATLTLEDGTNVPLSNLEIADNNTAGEMRVYQDAEGRPVYEFIGSNEHTSGWHTITTPKGGQYTVKLPDGTTIWLNAESKLSYPLNFLADRKVKLEGEAYFDVQKMSQTTAKLAHFTVELSGHSVQVLGTQFNINAYQENAHTQTTLIEGKVLINASESTRILRPGQQGTIAASGSGAITVHDVDVRSFADWKEGYFYFDELPIQEIMKKIAKWYNIEVTYTGKTPKEKFGGEVSRFENLQELLDLLEMTEKVHFKVEGRRVTVMP